MERDNLEVWVGYELNGWKWTTQVSVGMPVDTWDNNYPRGDGQCAIFDPDFTRDKDCTKDNHFVCEQPEAGMFL